MRRTPSPIRLLPLLLLPLPLLWGCAHNSNAIQAEPPGKSQEDVARRIKAIDDNPYMPAQAKEMAKSRVMAHAGKTMPGQ